MAIEVFLKYLYLCGCDTYVIVIPDTVIVMLYAITTFLLVWKQGSWEKQVASGKVFFSSSMGSAAK